MRRKIWSAAAAVFLAVAVFTGCTEQETMKGLVSSNTNLPPTDKTVNGISIYPMNQFIPDDAPRYSYQITSAKTFPTLAAAGLQAASLCPGSIYNFIDGEPQKIELEGENLPQGFAVLHLKVEVRADSEISQEDINPQVNNLTLTTKATLEGTERKNFKPVYNNEAPEKDRQTTYFFLPHIKKGESESFETAFLVPKSVLTDGDLYITFQEANGATTRAIQLGFDGGGKQ